MPVSRRERGLQWRLTESEEVAYIIDAQIGTAHGEEETDLVASTGMFSIG